MHASYTEQRLSVGASLASAICSVGVLVGSWSGPIAAQTIRDVGDYTVTRWTSANGLPSNVLTSLARTPDGFLWVGTMAGLARFDGVRFEVFDLTSTPEIGSARVRALAVDGEGALWIGTQSGSIATFRNGEFRRVLVGTIGATVFTPEFEALDTVTSFSWAAGGGIKYFFSKHIGIRAEYRLLSSSTNFVGRGGWCDWWGFCYTFLTSQRLYQSQFAFAAIFGF